MKNKKGLTLVELICTLAISLFLLVGLSSAIATIGAQYVRIMDTTRAKANATVMLETMEPRLRTASGAMLSNIFSLEIDYPWYIWYQGDDGEFMQVEWSGPLSREEVPLFDESVYGYFKYDIRYFKISETTIKCELTVYAPKGDKLYTGSFTASLLNVDTGSWDPGKKIIVTNGSGEHKRMAFVK